MDMPRRWIMYNSTRVGPGPMVKIPKRKVAFLSTKLRTELRIVLYEILIDTFCQAEFQR